MDSENYATIPEPTEPNSHYLVNDSGEGEEDSLNDESEEESEVERANGQLNRRELNRIENNQIDETTRRTNEFNESDETNYIETSRPATPKLPVISIVEPLLEDEAEVRPLILRAMPLEEEPQLLVSRLARQVPITARVEARVETSTTRLGMQGIGSTVMPPPALRLPRQRLAETRQEAVGEGMPIERRARTEAVMPPPLVAVSPLRQRPVDAGPEIPLILPTPELMDELFGRSSLPTSTARLGARRRRPVLMSPPELRLPRQRLEETRVRVRTETNQYLQQRQGNLEEERQR